MRSKAGKAPQAQSRWDPPKDRDGNDSAICDIGAFEVQPPALMCNGLAVTITGTPGNHKLAGTNGDDVIRGLAAATTSRPATATTRCAEAMATRTSAAAMAMTGSRAKTAATT